jgi:hypothetical protein
MNKSSKLNETLEDSEVHFKADSISSDGNLLGEGFLDENLLKDSY